MTIEFADDAQDLIAGYQRFRANRFREARELFRKLRDGHFTGRGAAIAGLLSGPLFPSVAEYTALQMKKAVVGHGHAAKAQIRHMVMRLLNLPREPHNDAADALGLAICHAHAGHAMAQMAKATDLTRRTHAQIKGGRVY